MGIAAYGTLIKRGDGATPENFVTIAEVVDITGPAMKVKAIDTTNHSSANAIAENVVGIIDMGVLKLTVNFMPDAPTQSYAAGLLMDLYQRNPRNYQLVWPNVAHTTWLLPCYVTGFDPKAPVDGKLVADFELDIYKAPTLA